MTVIDTFMSAMILLGLWRGFRAGAIRTAMLLVGWFVALVLATSLAKLLAVFFVNVVDSQALQIALAFLAVVFGVMSFCHLVIWLMQKTLRALQIGFVDKLLGGVLGTAVGVLKVLIILSISSPLLISLPSWQDSVLAQALLPFAPIAKALLVEAFGEAWRQLTNNPF